MVAPTFHRARMGSDVLIPCTFTIDKPSVDIWQLALSWRFQESKVLGFDNNISSTHPRASINTARIKYGDVSLYIPNAMISDGGIYKCLIIYSTERQNKEIRLDIEAPPQITITKRLVVTNRQSVLRAAITGFYPVDINVKWFKDGETTEPLTNYTVSTPQRNPDGTYSVTSMVTIMPTEEDKHRSFSCRVQHESLSEPLREDFHLIYGAFPSAEITSSAFYLNKEQELICHVWGFYPESITVNWFLNSSLVDSTKTRWINSSALEAVYKFTPTEKNQGLELSCEVEHDTLSHPLVRKLLVEGKVPSVFVQHNLTMVSVSLWWPLPIVTRPLQLSLCDPGEVLCSLNLESFYPKHIDISWSCDTGQSQKGISSQEKYQENPDQSYNAESACKIPGDSLKDPEFKVIVRWKHETMEDWESKELRVRDPDMSPLIVQLNQQATVKCTVSGYFPDVLTVTWFMKNARQETIPVSNGSKYEIPEISQEKMSDNTYTCTSTLCFTPTSNSEEQEFICRISHPSLEEPIERSTGPATTKVTEPIKFSLCESGEVLCSLYVSKFNPPNINITWTSGRDQTNKIKAVEKFIKIGDEKTHDAISECTIKWDQSLFPLHVTWKHEAMEEPEYKELEITDFPWIPAVGEISVPALLAGSECTMTCDINNYFPDNNLTVTWLKKEKEGHEITPVSSNEYYQIPDLQHVKQQDHTYSCTAHLDFKPSYESDYGAEFICRVEHPNLKGAIERRTEPLQVTGDDVPLSHTPYL
uniref:Ig-like domain-containing protein n=1 Tax=Leptobrachium leishanense TaxID=445787 RepID=A0A8C5QSZ5_9ANUR